MTVDNAPQQMIRWTVEQRRLAGALTSHLAHSIPLFGLGPNQKGQREFFNTIDRPKAGIRHFRILKRRKRVFPSSSHQNRCVIPMLMALVSTPFATGSATCLDEASSLKLPAPLLFSRPYVPYTVVRLDNG